MPHRNFTRITVNGTTYESVEQMPPDVRDQLERAMAMLADRNQNGVPDVLEGGKLDVHSTAGETTTHITAETKHEYIVDGRRYESLKDLPPAVRAALNSPQSHPSRAGYGKMQVNLSLSTLLAILVVMLVALVVLAWLW